MPFRNIKDDYATSLPGTIILLTFPLMYYCNKQCFETSFVRLTYD